jgi:hypothetical protein
MAQINEKTNVPISVLVLIGVPLMTVVFNAGMFLGFIKPSMDFINLRITRLETEINAKVSKDEMSQVYGRLDKIDEKLADYFPEKFMGKNLRLIP